MPSTLSSPLLLQHETHPAIALKVLRTRRFVAGPILGDAGLNAFIVVHPRGNYRGEQAAQRGAILEFEWSGPVSAEDYGVYPDLDVCYDQHPHRAFVFVGTTQHLRLVGLKLKSSDGWAEYVRRPVLSLSTFWPWLQSRRGGWVKKQAQLIAEEVERILAERPPVRIVLPRSSPYQHLVRKRYPNIE